MGGASGNGVFKDSGRTEAPVSNRAPKGARDSSRPETGVSLPPAQVSGSFGSGKHLFEEAVVEEAASGDFPPELHKVHHIAARGLLVVEGIEA